jgi:O-antigen/teichoic acid export membrane protein
MAEKITNIENTFKLTFFKNVLISGGYNYLAQGITFFSSIIIARLLSPENYGLVGLITVFTGFISVFSDSGISLAIIKSDYGYTYHKSLDTLALMIGIILFCLMAILAYPIAVFYKNSSLILPTLALSTTFIFRSMSIVRGALLSKSLQFGYLGKVILISSVISILLTIVLAYYGAQHWAIIIPQIVSSLVNVVMYEYQVRLRYQIYSFKYVKVAYKQTKKIIGSLIGFNLVNYWARNSDNLLVGKLYGINDLGIYNRAYSLLMFPLSLITGLMSSVLYPSLKKLMIDGGDVNAEYLFILKIISFLVLPISVLLLLFPETLVSVLWGAKWLKVAALLPYFGLLIFSQHLLSSVGNLLVLKGEERALMYSGWVGAIITISSIFFGAMYSIIAIAQCYSLGFIVLVLPFNIWFIYYKTLKFPPIVLLKFWSPIIILSIFIWVGCFVESKVILYSSIIVLFVVLLTSSFKEVIAIVKMVKATFKH